MPRAADGYAALERIGKQLTFVTNNSVRTMDQCVRRFAKIGLQVKPEQIWHPAQSIVEYLQSIKFEGLIYIIASQPFKAVLREAGFQLLDGVSDLSSKIAMILIIFLSPTSSSRSPSRSWPNTSLTVSRCVPSSSMWTST